MKKSRPCCNFRSSWAICQTQWKILLFSCCHVKNVLGRKWPQANWRKKCNTYGDKTTYDTYKVIYSKHVEWENDSLVRVLDLQVIQNLWLWKEEYYRHFARPRLGMWWVDRAKNIGNDSWTCDRCKNGFSKTPWKIMNCLSKGLKTRDLRGWRSVWHGCPFHLRLI